MSSKTRKVFIEGMHCVSCEKLLDDELGNIEGVERVKVDRKENCADITCSDEKFDWGKIKNTAEKFGYRVYFQKNSSNKTESKNKTGMTEWINAIGITVVILFAYRIFQNFGLLDSIIINESAISYGAALLIGLVASVSSCLVIVGGVVIAFGEKYESRGKNFFERSLKPNLLFQAGRLGTFFVLGGALGVLGGEISISGSFVSVFTIGISLVMLWLGMDILGIFPSISRLGVRMPKKLTVKWDSLKKSEHQAAPFLLGGLSFFLPCGFTQSMQLFAFASGNFWTGSISLLLFAIGTLPSLLVLGTLASWTKNKKMIVFQKVAGFLVIIFAIYTFQSGSVLLGAENSVLSSDDIDQSVSVDKNSQSGQIASGEEQIARMKITNSGFDPSVIRIKKGVPVKFIIDGDQVSGCTNKILIPDYKISAPIKAGENIIRFTPTKAGTINYSCWMGMVRGKFIVE